MLVLIFAIVIFFWLVVGAVQYVACVASPRLRRYALSAALWWAVWGPCSVALMMLAGLVFVAEAFAVKDGLSGVRWPRLALSLGWTYLGLGVLGTAATATVVAWLHQVIMWRLTFALFRLYASVVSAGVGSVFGWCLSWWIASNGWPYGWIPALAGLLVVTVMFGVVAYRHARALRGEAPIRYPLVSREEFEGI